MRPLFPVKDPTLLRLFEDVYGKMTRSAKDSSLALADTHERIAGLEKRLVDTQAKPTKPPGKALPIPQDLSVVKLGPFGLASVAAFEMAKYPGLVGYEFFGSSESGFTCNADSRITLGAFPWCAFFCSLQEPAYYVRCRTYSLTSVSPLTAEASSEDKPGVPEFTVEQKVQVGGGHVYFFLGQPRVDVIVTYTHRPATEAVVDYDIKYTEVE